MLTYIVMKYNNNLQNNKSFIASFFYTYYYFIPPEGTFTSLNFFITCIEIVLLWPEIYCLFLVCNSISEIYQHLPSCMPLSVHPQPHIHLIPKIQAPFIINYLQIGYLVHLLFCSIGLVLHQNCYYSDKSILITVNPVQILDLLEVNPFNSCE